MLLSLRRLLFILMYLAMSDAQIGNAQSSQNDLDPEQSAKDSEFFESRIRPVLIANCYKCHNSSGKSESGLAVDSRDAFRKGGDRGLTIVPGDPAGSPLIGILKHEVAGLVMPKDGAKLSDEVIADFETWIVNGAVDPRDTPPTREELLGATSWEAIREQRREWWSFQPIQEHQSDSPENNGWSSHLVDRFIMDRLAEHHLVPAARADNSTLIRRLFFTVIGLPPTLEELTEWEKKLAGNGEDGSRKSGESQKGLNDVACAELIDHLLQRQEFGERWARHWMDWLRYADSHGSEGDPALVGAWHYRDYLIRALNDDVSYDQMVREHIAGDLLPSPRENEALGLNESAIATAHWRMVFHGFAPTDALEERVRFTDDEINTFSKAFLGLTVACARCHDHKFDPISQKDYYALSGILSSCRPGRAAVDLPARLNRNTHALEAAKAAVRTAVAKSWLAYGPEFKRRLLEDQSIWTNADQPHWLLYDWRELQTSDSARADFPKWWQDKVDVWQRARKALAEFRQQSATARWDMSLNEDRRQWSQIGNGLTSQQHIAGQFQLETDGTRIVARIFPASIVSGLVSTRDAARLESRDVLLTEGQTMWLQIAGSGGAKARYVVQNYPRDGTVYPVVKLGSDWVWQKFDVGYWEGDSVHIELANALDNPLLVEPSDRSWFAIRYAVLQSSELSGPPAEAHEHVNTVYELANQKPPTTSEQLADTFARAFETAVRNWQDESMTDDQSLLLQALLSQNLLPNSTDQLPELAPLLDAWRTLETERIVPTRVPGLQESTPSDRPLYVRGDHRQPAEIVPRRFLEVIDETPYDVKDSGRLKLSDDVLRPDNPLTRRVIVNRLWHHLFGRGLVGTPDNLGRLGQEPTHPALLDSLALRFSEDGWSMKKAIRLMLTSRTWQQASQPSAEAVQHDPDNSWWSHAMARRLDGEAIRDSLLATSGMLEPQRFGPPVRGNSSRRSVYVEVRRNDLDPFLRAFDFPEPFSATGRRDVTNVPAQALILMNDPAIASRASRLADRIVGDSALRDDQQRVTTLYRLVLSRSPSTDEIAEALRFVADTRDGRNLVLAQSAMLRVTIDAQRRTISEIKDPVRKRLFDALTRQSPDNSVIASGLKPLAAWKFDVDANDLVGSTHLDLKGGAMIRDGALLLDGGQAYAASEPLRAELREKTLSSWVQLDNLDQRAGGVMSVQSLDGSVFDSIVFAERDPQQWLAGSDGFARTQPFNGLQEAEAVSQPVHLAIVYHANGETVGFRNGHEYGSRYVSRGMHPFPAGSAMVSFGIRHLPVGQGKMLSGRILEAQLFDRALASDEVAALASGAASFVSDEDVMAQLTEAQKRSITEAEGGILAADAQLKALGPVPDDATDRIVWTDLVRAVVGFKEFIYLR